MLYKGLDAKIINIIQLLPIEKLQHNHVAWFINGIFTPKGLLVTSLHFRICSLNILGYIDPAPIRPKPPELLTDDANSHPLHHIIPPWIIGYFIPKSSLILFIKLYTFVAITKIEI